MAPRHPEADIRPWLAQHPQAGNRYTRQRIGESYAHIQGVLSRVPDDRRDAAYDVGCGTAFDTFALAAHFDRVLAIDRSRRWIRASQRLARDAGVGHVRFDRRRAEEHDPGDSFDFVYCNIMSDLTRSRRALIQRLVGATAPGGDIFYAEAIEGYAAAELARAVARRDGPEVRLRLRQAINGFAGRPAFRFFVGGSAAPLFEAFGATVVTTETIRTDGLPAVERLWLRRGTDSRAPAGHDGAHDDADYLTMPRELQEIRVDYRAATEGKGRTPEDLLERARTEGGRLAPWLVLLAMALETPGARPQDAGWVRPRLGDKGLSPLRPSDPDWARMDELMRDFERLAARG